MLVKKSSFFMECFPGQKRSARVGGYIPGRIKYCLSTWDTLDEMSIRIFLFLPIPPLIVVWIMVCAWGGSRCNCWSARVTFLAFAFVGKWWNGRRCWELGGVGVVLLIDERTDKLVIGSEEMES